MKQTRFGSLLLAVAMLLTLLPVSALAAEDPAAKIGETPYATLADAFEAVGTEPVTITLLKDTVVSAPISIDPGETVTLDMQSNTVTVSNDFSGRMFTNNGTLTIQGSGAIDVSNAGANGYGTVNNFGTLTVVDGTYTNPKESDASNFYNRNGGTATFENVTIHGGGGCVATEVNTTTTINGGYYENATYPSVENRGNMLITGGSFKNTSCSSCDGKWGYTVRSGESAENAYLKIQGEAEDSVKVTGVQGGLAVIGGTADIYNGSYETVACETHGGSSAFYAGYFTGESYKTATTIYGGSFQSCSKTAVLVGNGNPAPDSGAGKESTVMIQGGSFVGGDAAKTAISVNKTEYAVGAANITGGTFSSDVSAYVDLSSNVTTDDAGSFVIIPNEKEDGVAEIDGRYYKTLDDALASAGEGDTIKLLKDLVLDQGFYLVNKPGITIDGDGHSISASDSFTDNSYGQHNLMKLDSCDGASVKNLTLITSEKAKHALDLYGSDNVVLENVTLDHSAAEGGAALVINQSKVTAKGSFAVVVGSHSWYGINIDDKGVENSSALTFDSSVSFTFTDKSEGQNKEILFVEPNTDPDTAVIDPENAGLVSNGDGTFDPAPISSSPSYTITVDKADNGAVTASRTRANKGLTITLTVKPDEGYVLDELTVTDKNGNEIKLTDKGDGKYTFTMPASAVTVTASFLETPVADPLPFTDVAVDDWFYSAVEYVYSSELMDGTSSTTFAPLMTTNRAMIVTILWRQAGSPVVDYAMNFTDVADGAWYTEAVRWAASEGIVTGYSDTVFAPDDTVTREQLAAILYRYAENEGYDVSAKGDLTTFADGADTSSWAAEAMEWAVGSGLLTGKDGGKLDPTGTATRAEVATILMRFVTENA